MLLFLLVSVSCCYFVYKIIQKYLVIYKKYQILKNMPGPPLDSIILGNITEMLVPLEDMPKSGAQLFKKHGGIYRLWNFLLPLIFISKEDYAEIFFTAASLSTKAALYKLTQVWMGLGIINSHGQQHKERRKLINSAFHVSALKVFSDIFANNALTLIHKLKEHHRGMSIDVYPMMQLLSLDNICETIMGIKIDALNNPKLEYIRAVRDATHTLMNRAKAPWYWNDSIFFLLPIGRKLKKDLRIIFELTNTAINDRKSEKTLRDEKHGDVQSEEKSGKRELVLLDHLLDACESESIHLLDEDLRDEVNTLMYAGHDATASSLSLTLYLLGLHPEIQKKCYQELTSIFQDSCRKPTVTDLQNMTYLEQAIKESLRLFPSAPVIGRQATEDSKIGEYTIPKDSMVTLNVYNLHRDPKHFPDPEKFDPDRFTPENVAKRHAYAYVPFAAGARTCLGYKFAMMQEKVVLSYILRNFTLESTHAREELKIYFAVVLQPQKSIDIIFKPRNEF